MSKKRIFALVMTLCAILSLCFATVLAVSAESEGSEALTEAMNATELAEGLDTASSDTVAVTESETSQDLGGAFSKERLLYAGQMLVLGMAMVFLVLAILWLVLLVFKTTMYKKDKNAKEEKKKKADTSAPSVSAAPNDHDEALAAAIAAAMVATEDDGATVAAITAAISAMIAFDDALSKEFAGGFRVVSFRRKSGKGAWNK